MSALDELASKMAKPVPFNAHNNVELIEIGDGKGVARLPDGATSKNHIDTQHAGALFLAGEAASGGAMASAILEVFERTRPVASDASIKYKRIATGDITATAVTDKPAADILTELKDTGKSTFDVKISLTNEKNVEVAEMTVSWHVTLVK